MAAPRLLVVLASLASSSTTAPACDGDGPTVAICVAGNARTFREAAVHGSYKPNLADAFGGKRTVLFAFLKATDRGWKGASREENLGRGSLVDATAAGELERIVKGMGLEVGALEVIDGLHTEPEPHCQRKYFMTHHPDPNASDAWRARFIRDVAAKIAGSPRGVTGALGYELATAAPVAHAASDIDIVVCMPERHDLQLETLAGAVRRCDEAHGVRCDIQLETPAGGVALADWQGEAACVMIKHDTGPYLSADPWQSP